MNRRTAALPLTVAAGAAIAVGAGFAAGAGSSPAKPAPRLTQPALVKPFVAFGDRAVYDLVPGGDFTPNTSGSWALTGGASVVANGVDASQSGTRALSLATGASATSAAFPGRGVHTVRFFAQNLGSSTSKLNVTATVTENGTATTIPLGTVTASGLAPTPVLTLPSSLVSQLTQSNSPIKVTLTPQGQNSRWLVKDVYVDPWMRCGDQC